MAEPEKLPDPVIGVDHEVAHPQVPEGRDEGPVARHNRFDPPFGMGQYPGGFPFMPMPMPPPMMAMNPFFPQGHEVYGPPGLANMEDVDGGDMEDVDGDDELALEAEGADHVDDMAEPAAERAMKMKSMTAMTC